MSSLAAPATPPATPTTSATLAVQPRWRTMLVPGIATLASVALAYVAWLYGDQPIRGDSLGYYEMGLGMVRNGPASFASDFRTYGYPAVLALLIGVVGADPERVRTAGFALQLVLFLGVAWLGARRLSRALGMPAWEPWLYAITAFSPFILLHTIQMLTDVLSAIMLYAAVILTIPDARSQETGDRRQETGGSWKTWAMAGLALLLAGLGVIVRPSNIALLPVLLLAWIFRTVRYRDLPWRAWPVLLAMLVLPFVPQMAFNQRAFGVPHPLIVLDLYGTTTTLGMRTAKYATISMTGIPARLFYNNPLGPPSSMTAATYAQIDPLRFVGTLGLHAFALIDQDFPFTYIRDLTPWYRWPLAIPNYLYVLGGLLGLLVGLRWPTGQTSEERERSRVTFLVLGMAVGALIAIYLPVTVECRYGLPLYPLLAAPFLLTVTRLRSLAVGRPWLLAVTAIVAAAWVGALAMLSVWMDQQAPLLLEARAAVANPPPSPAARYAVDLPEDWDAGETVDFPISVTNTGADTWNVEGIFPVAVRAQFVARNNRQHALLPPGSRVYVVPTASLEPGQSETVTAKIQTPTDPGRYGLKITVIRHGIDETQPDFEKQVRVERPR